MPHDDTPSALAPVLDLDSLEPAGGRVTAYGETSWLAFHLHDPVDINRVVTDFVAPVAEELTGAERVASWYFIRYGEGAPHVRLRLALPEGGDADAIPEITWIVARHARSYYDRWPMEASAAEMETAGREVARPELLREAVFAAPVELEEERYGGPEHYPASFRFFAMSSAHALNVTRALQGQPRGRMLPAFIGQLARQADGFARDGEERLEMFHYFVGWREVMGPILEKGDQVYEQQPEVFQTLVRHALEDPEPHPLRDGAATLSREIEGAPPEVRRQIGISQMHMTANRLGLLNAEESYVTQMMWRAGQDLG